MVTKYFNEYDSLTTVLRTESLLVQSVDVGAVPGTSRKISISELQAVPFDFVQLLETPPTPTPAPGMMWNNAAEKAINYCPGWDSGNVVAQIPYEHWFPMRNSTATLIPNGTPVVPIGTDGTYMLVIPSDAASKGRVVRNVQAVATMDLVPFVETPASAAGVGTRLGRVRNFNTAHLTAGELVFLAPGGGLTSTVPSWPNSQIVVGLCHVSHATLGEITVDIRAVTLDSEFDGSVIEKQDATIVEGTGPDAGKLFIDVELIGGGNLPFQLDGDRFQLDCTTGAGGAGTGGGTQARSPELTQGTATTAVRNFVWIELVADVPTLVVGTDWPTGTSYSDVCMVTIFNAAKHATDDALSFRETTNSIAHNSRGRIGYIMDWIRSQNATYISGVDPTVTINSVATPDEVGLTTAAGIILQAHRLTFPAYDIATDGIWIANSLGAGTLDNYDRITDLNVALEEADGTSLSGKRFNLVVIGVISKETGQCKLLLNLPTGSYISDSLCYDDPDNTAVLSAPENIRFESFPILRIPMRHKTSGGGEWTFCGDSIGRPQIISLLGTTLGGSGSATGGAAQQFSDAIFEIFNNADNTKRFALDVSGVPTATTRTVAVPGADGTQAVLEFTQSWVKQYMQLGDASNRNSLWATTGNYSSTVTISAGDNSLILEGFSSASFRLRTTSGGNYDFLYGQNLTYAFLYDNGRGADIFRAYRSDGHMEIDSALVLGDVLTLTGAGSDPSSPSDGMIWHRTDTDEIRARLGGTTYILDMTAV